MRRIATKMFSGAAGRRARGSRIPRACGRSMVALHSTQAKALLSQHR
jgi:hypothetical protein